MESTSERKTVTERPTVVSRAVQLLLLSLAIGVVKAAFQLTQRTSGTTLLFALLIVIAFFGLLFFFVMKISAGKNWARIILLVLVLIGIPFGFPQYLEELRRNVVAGTLSIIIALLQLIGTFLLFKKQSNTWFRTPK